MTPAINTLKQRKITHKIHEFHHQAGHGAYGLEAVEKLGVPEQQVFKTLVVNLDQHQLVVAVIPVTAKLSMKLVAKAMGAKKALMADPSAVERSTGYVLGGVSPLGQKKRLKTVIDCSAQHQTTIYVSGGRRGLEIELTPNDLANLTSAEFICVVESSEGF